MKFTKGQKIKVVDKTGYFDEYPHVVDSYKNGVLKTHHDGIDQEEGIFTFLHFEQLAGNSATGAFHYLATSVGDPKNLSVQFVEVSRG